MNEDEESKDFDYTECPWHKDETLPCCIEDPGWILLDIRCTHPKRVRDKCFPDGVSYAIDKPAQCPLTDDESKDMWM